MRRSLCTLVVFITLILAINSEARMYQPATGRWMSRDPIGEESDPNLYRGMGNNAVNNIDPDGLTWESNWRFFKDWAGGEGSNNRTYGPNTVENQEMQGSPGADALRNTFYSGGCKSINKKFNYESGQAAEDTLPHPSTTGAQVGGFAGASAINNGDGTVTFIISNVAGAHSFFYHVVPDRKGTTGPMRNIKQTFQWTEKIDESRCKDCKK
jgi:hypothetical protein